MSVITKVADAIAEELKGAELSLPFTVRRAFRDEQILPERNELAVAVIPKGIAVAPLARGMRRHDVEVYVTVSRKVERAAPEIIDPLAGFVEEIADFFGTRRLALFPAAMWTKTENKPYLSTEHLRDHSCFTSLLTLAYQVARR